jgi:hypothetical protein
VRSSLRFAVVVPDRFSERIVVQPSLQRGNLNFEVLIGGADTGIADNGHGARAASRSGLSAM